MPINWTTAKYLGRCSACQAEVIQGDTIAFVAPGRRTLCLACGKRAQGRDAEQQEARRQAAAAHHRTKPKPD